MNFNYLPTIASDIPQLLKAVVNFIHSFGVFMTSEVEETRHFIQCIRFEFFTTK